LDFGASPPLIVTPILRAVPATIRIAESTVKQFKSGILSSAIARTCVHETDPTLTRLGSEEPFLILECSII